MQREQSRGTVTEFKIGEHCHKMPGNVMSLIAELELMDPRTNPDINICLSLLIKLTQKIVNCNKKFYTTDKNKEDPDWKEFINRKSFTWRVELDSLVHDWNYLVTSNAPTIFMNVFIDMYYTPQTDLLWFAKTTGLQKDGKDYRWLQKAASEFDLYGFPTHKDAGKFHHRYGFCPVLRTDTMQALKWQSLLVSKIIGLMHHSILDPKKCNFWKMQQWEAFLQKFIEIWTEIRLKRS